MNALRQGVLRFRYRTYSGYKELFEKLSNTQKPSTLFITCADSRIDPNLLTDSVPGTLFVDRNAGNFIPEPRHPNATDSSVSASEEATIEFAIKYLKVANIVICGHSDCGAMKALMADAESIEHLPAVGSWIENGRPALHTVQAEKGWSALTPAKQLERLAKANVELQVARVSKYLGNYKKKPQVAGWYFNIGHGEVHEFIRRGKKDIWAPIEF